MKKVTKFCYTSTLLILTKLSIALNSSYMPGEMGTQASMGESVIVWIMRLGGVAAVFYVAYMGATNKLQGQLLVTAITAVLCLAGAIFFVTWWLNKAPTQGFLF